MAQKSGFAPEEIDSSIIDDGQIPVIKYEELALEKVEAVDLGNMLPVGVFLDGERLQAFVLSPYKTKHDRILGQLLSAPKVKISQVLGQFLPQVVETIGGFTLKEIAGKLSLSTSKLVENMPLADALTLVLAIRLGAQGPDIAMSAQCPACGAQNDDDPAKGRPYHDLSSVEVSIVKDLRTRLQVEVTLIDGIDDGSEKIKTLLMQPLRLFQVDKIATPGSGVPVDIGLLYSMVSAIPNSPTYANIRGQVFSDNLYDELTMKDLNLLRKVIEKLQPGPDMNADMTCSSCGNEWKAAIGWGSLRQFLYVPAEAAV